MSFFAQGEPRDRRRPTWRDRYPEEALTCVRCLEVRPKEELDRLLWCEGCRTAARARATRRGWVAGALVALVLALWIWLFVQPSSLVIGGWIATVVAFLWVGAKIGREVAYGIERFENHRAVEAVPPSPEDAP